jgi:methionyl-tRNA formyltransferase
MKLGLLASGALGSKVVNHLISKSKPIFVMTDKGSTTIIDLCKSQNIPCFIGNPRGGRCKEFILDKEIDVLISANYLYIIDDELIKLPKILAFNIHGSLLPKYRGRTPHVWAIINNEVETGITAHLIDSGCDTGEIIEQIIIPINESDTGADILEKFNRKYTPLIDNVLQKIKNTEIHTTPQDNSKATFFGKRTPEDGRINWNWQKERIRNWVRAQAFPYPGAFSIINNKKFIIDEVIFDDSGYNDEMENGLILSVDPIRVKSPNGVLKVTKHREINIELLQYSIFN